MKVTLEKQKAREKELEELVKGCEQIIATLKKQAEGNELYIIKCILIIT